MAELTRTTHWRHGSPNWAAWLLRYGEGDAADRQLAHNILRNYHIAQHAAEAVRARAVERERIRNRNHLLQNVNLPMYPNEIGLRKDGNVNSLSRHFLDDTAYGLMGNVRNVFERDPFYPVHYSMPAHDTWMKENMAGDRVPTYGQRVEEFHGNDRSLRRQLSSAFGGGKKYRKKSKSKRSKSKRSKSKRSKSKRSK